MKNTKRFTALLIAAAMLLGIGLSGCKNNETPESTPTTTDQTLSSQAVYSVSVVDPLGNACSDGIFVEFLQDGQVAAMQAVTDGVAQKELPRGNYTVNLSFLESGEIYYYDPSNLTLTEEKTELEIVLSYGLGDVYQEISAYSEAQGDHVSYTAWAVGEGFTYAQMNTSDRNYFLFTPERAGLYEISVLGSDAQVGYYGNVFFVQTANLAEASDNGIVVSISEGMVGASLVLGVDSTAESQMLCISRIGDAEVSIADLPWTVYETTAQLAPFVLNSSITTAEFDLTAGSDAYTLVYNEEDGFYHLDSADGPLVYMKLGAKSTYLDSIQTVLESSGISKYFFDENGEFVKKESYTECLMEYIENMDADSGLYPLTADLEYIILQRGSYVGWWDPDSDGYLFLDANLNPIVGINHDIAWLFLCCYGQTEETPDETQGNEAAEGTEATEPADKNNGGDKNTSGGSSSGGSSSGGSSSGGSSSGGSSSGGSSSGGSSSGGSSSGGSSSGGSSSGGSSSGGSSSGGSSSGGSSSGGSSSGGSSSGGSSSGGSSSGGSSSGGSSSGGSSSGGSSSGGSSSGGSSSGGSSSGGSSSGGSSSATEPTEETEPAPTETEPEPTQPETQPTEPPEEERKVGIESSADTVEINPSIFEGDNTWATFDASVKAGEYANFDLYRFTNMVLTIQSEDAYVIFNGQVYWPEDGTVTFELVYKDLYTPCSLAIGNSGDEDAVFEVYLGTPVGEYMNPKKLSLGDFTTKIAAGDEDGYFYKYTATASGVFSITLNSSTAECGIQIQNNANSTVASLDEAEGDTVSIRVSKGDVLIIFVGVTDTEHPAATIKATASFVKD